MAEAAKPRSKRRVSLFCKEQPSVLPWVLKVAIVMQTPPPSHWVVVRKE